MMSNAYANHGTNNHGYIVHSPHHHNQQGRWVHRHGRWEWVLPATIITGVIIANEMNRQNQQPNIICVDRNDIIQSQCGPWREVQDGNGAIYRERVCRD